MKSMVRRCREYLGGTLRDNAMVLWGSEVPDRVRAPRCAGHAVDCRAPLGASGTPEAVIDSASQHGACFSVAGIFIDMTVFSRKIYLAIGDKSVNERRASTARRGRRGFPAFVPGRLHENFTVAPRTRVLRMPNWNMWVHNVARIERRRRSRYRGACLRAEEATWKCEKWQTPTGASGSRPERKLLDTDTRIFIHRILMGRRGKWWIVYRFIIYYFMINRNYQPRGESLRIHFFKYFLTKTRTGSSEEILNKIGNRNRRATNVIVQLEVKKVYVVHR